MDHCYVRFPGGKSKCLTLSYDDGVQQDKQLVKMMEARGVKGTFNLNSECIAPEGTRYPRGQVHRRMTEKECLETYASPCCEVALHGAYHPFLDKITTPQAMYDIARDRYLLERMFGRVIRGMAYPYGTTSDEVVDILKMADVAYCRTTLASHDFELPKDPLRLSPTCHHDDPLLMDLLDAFLREEPRREARMFYLWGHAYEFEGNDNWQRIETFLNAAAGHEDVWYATNIEIISYLEAFAQRKVSVDGHIIYNPTCTDLWMEIGGAIVSVPAGATVRI